MKKYSLGLDIGTNSVGWAVVDENNQLVKKNGFTLWGVRMFEESNDASARRGFRTGRRRLNRRNQRIKLLRDIFIQEIYKVDPTFFERMDDSFYKLEDKRNNVNNLFVNDYTDAKFYTEFPTIYHLRKHLINSNKKEDIRFIYLALHNMIKFRGNFLTQGETFNKSDNQRIIDILSNFNDISVSLMEEFEDFEDYLSPIKIDDDILNQLEKIMLSHESKNDKKKNIKALLNCENKSLVNEFLIPLLVSGKINMSTLNLVKANKYDKCEVVLSSDDLVSVINEKMSMIPELNKIFDFIPSIKEISDHYFLIKLLQNSDYLCEAMIKKYNEHKKDLARLKEFIKNYLPNKYNECFRIHDNKLNNYAKYIGMNDVEGCMDRFSHCKRDDFYSYVLSLLKLVNDSSAEYDINYFKSKIENDDFLLRQNSDQNGSLPMQLNLAEIKIILDKQSKYYPFLLEKDDNNLSNAEKIISIFKFVVPYYVGPLNQSSYYSWIVRTDEKVLPWNFEKIVNVDETAKIFIERMQRKCTYLKGEYDYCLPKNSIIFSKYNCLSYLNKLNINGSLISTKLKHDIFNNVFLKIKKPTKKNLIDYLQSNYGDSQITTSKFKELPEINCDMSSYIKFNEIFGDVNDNIEMIERIIKDIVIFTDKKILEKRLINVYNLDKEKIRKIKDLNYQGYSNISNKLLSEIEVTNYNTGEIHNGIIDIMWNTNLNLQEILYDQNYRLMDEIDKYNKGLSKEDEESIEEFIEQNINVTPIMKRPLIQALNIINELENKILKQKFDKYYIECSRTNKAEKKPTSSRYNKLKDLYKESKNLALEWNIDLNELNKTLDDNKEKLKSDLIFLYFTQFGRCMYSLEKIEFDDLFNNYKYDIDHIYPQSLIKDDSITNRVLVKKELNNKKQDNFLFEIPSILNKDAYKFYELLFELKMIPKEKYLRLTKKEILSSELDVFVNRQIVSTNQAVKGLIQVLKLYNHVDTSNIVFSKAENISMARKLFDWPKSRVANNYHHAHDAYLNVVIGRVINDYYVANYFNTASDYYRLKSENKTINPEKLLKYDRTINGKLIWDKEKMVKLINHNLYERYDVSETIRTYNSNDLFSKVTILPSGEGTVPIKSNDARADVNKYGGITSNSFSKYVIVKHVVKKGVEYILEAIPKKYENSIDEYLKIQGYSQYEIVHNNIKTNVIVNYEDLSYVITGKSENSLCIKNNNDRFFDKSNIKCIKKIEKYNDNLAKKNIMIVNEDNVIISPAKDHKCNSVVLHRNELEKLYFDIKNKYQLKIYSFSTIKTIYNQMPIDLSNFSIQNLIELLSELLNLLQTNSRKTADLTLISMSKFSGSLRITKKLLPGMKLISKSVTGYYQKVLFEVPR